MSIRTIGERGERAIPSMNPANMIIGQSGGPTAVINQSLVGAVLNSRRLNDRCRIVGTVHGIRGIIEEDFVDLTKVPERDLERVARTPSAALGSIRMKPNEDDCRAMLEVFEKREVGTFYYIGGNDSAEAALLLQGVADAANYPLRIFHIPKTIDNDLHGSDHTPGFGSAARFVAMTFIGEDLENRSLPGVNINVVMGRDAGFLTAASVLGRSRPESGPHLVYVPERAFELPRFLEDIENCMQKYGRCLIAVSEGIRDAEGRRFAENLCSEVDSFGNVQLSGTGALGDFLAEKVRGNFGPAMRVRAATLGYLQRSFIGAISEVDAAEARRVGEVAAELAGSGAQSGSVSLLREKSTDYRIRYERIVLEEVAKHTRQMPEAFISPEGNNITPEFERYARPIVGDLPTVEYLDAMAA